MPLIVLNEDGTLRGQVGMRHSSYNAIEVSDSELAALLAARESFKSWPTPEFFAKLTQEEKAAILTSSDINVKVLWATFSLHPTVENNNAELIAGLDYLTAIGLLGPNRKAELLA